VRLSLCSSVVQVSYSGLILQDVVLKPAAPGLAAHAVVGPQEVGSGNDVRQGRGFHLEDGESDGAGGNAFDCDVSGDDTDRDGRIKVGEHLLGR